MTIVKELRDQHPHPSLPHQGGGLSKVLPHQGGGLQGASIPPEIAARYAVAITPEMEALIDPTDPADPIAAQFVPDPRELAQAPEEDPDPIGDERFSPVKGIVHRHPDRVLLKPSLLCPVYCRFCFRRETVGQGSASTGAMLSEAELAAALDYVAGHPEIWEVVVTGGDPFLLAPRRIAALVERLDGIPHLGVIRFHTRVPVVDPSRIDAALTLALSAGKAVYVVVHSNHPRELTPSMRDACGRIVRAGIPMLSQTVLLKGVNDDAETLTALMRGLVAMRIKPYYLHHADLAPGTAHFRTSLAEGQALMRQMRGDVSGLCQPSYVLDLPGGHGKVPVGPCYAAPLPEGEGWSVEDGHGAHHLYPPKP